MNQNGGQRRRVLVTADDFHASLALVRALDHGGYAPVLAASSPHVYAAYSRAVERFVAVPDAHDVPQTFAGAVVRAASELGVSAVLPGTEASLIALARHRDELPVPLGAPATEVVELATDKARVLELAAGYGFEAPPSTIGTPTELAGRADTFSYPVILKPQRTRLELEDERLAYFTASRIDSPAGLRTALAPLPELGWVIQPYLTARLSAVCGVAWDGAVHGTVHQVAVRTWPAEAGYSCCAQTVPHDRELDRRVTGLVGELGWSGLFQVQMLAMPDGRRLMIDFNPRAYGSLALAWRAGANLAGAWADLVHGLEPAPIGYRVGVRYRLEHNDLRAIGAMLAAGQARAGLAALVPHRGTAHAIFSWRDPKPLLITAGKLLGKVKGA